MARHQFLAGALIAAVIGATTPAQLGPPPVVNPPNFAVSLHAVGLLASGASMAADRFGNVFIVDQPNVSAGNGTITMVDASGVVQPGFASGLGALSQAAYNPADGFCYIASWAPLLPVVHARIWRLVPGTGAVQHDAVTLIPSGFTIDNAGLMYFGAQTALGAPGLYRHDPAGPPGNATFLSPGHAQNAILQSLVSGDVLIGGGNQVRRWTPMAVNPVPYYTHPVPLPNAFAQVNSLARTPFNQLGAGGLIGIREFGTLCFCGQGLTVSAGLTGQNPQIFAFEPYNAPFTGLRCIASGIGQDEWWYTDQPGPGPLAGKLLWRIRQVPAHGSPGSLIADTAPGLVTFHVYGPGAGGDPFLLGAVSALLPVDVSWFAPPYGIIDLGPFHPLYIPLLDGVGIFGPPNPFARIPAGGHFQMAISIPPGGSGLAFRLQALTLSPNVAPNGLFHISNVEFLVLP